MSKEKQHNRFFRVIQSTIAGLFGIQSERNRQEDFKEKSPFDYILAGIIGVIALLVIMTIVVKSVLP
ncbi:MAG TPA: DUF2970 domain-containing protein [Gammaproteobacteria bacterium]|nr:DUF2970 domain-containing protein [Pseudomonadota bacterium]HBF08892.1 DUF2970 domain-containing protein [Gammaproteobacteria bacterium]HCK94082.1 DUF2970 domain-containing protein [Gammaproteobacteria bacterium]|tara:strand:- start:1524 stop:1724 length:201 start_codon:yes stop_codon:yes gene_type:complete